MPFKPGHKLATGRPKGSKNKVKTIIEFLEKTGFDPNKEAERLFWEAYEDGDRGTQLKILENMWKYINPAPKTVQHTGSVTVDSRHEIVTTERRLVTAILENPKALEAVKVIEAATQKQQAIEVHSDDE